MKSLQKVISESDRNFRAKRGEGEGEGGGAGGGGGGGKKREP